MQMNTGRKNSHIWLRVRVGGNSVNCTLLWLITCHKVRMNKIIKGFTRMNHRCLLGSLTLYKTRIFSPTVVLLLLIANGNWSANILERTRLTEDNLPFLGRIIKFSKVHYLPIKDHLNVRTAHLQLSQIQRLKCSTHQAINWNKGILKYYQIASRAREVKERWKVTGNQQLVWEDH